MRTDIVKIEFARGNSLAVHEDCFGCVVDVEPAEELLVADNGRPTIGSRDGHGLEYVLDLKVAGLGRAVGKHASVHHECTVVWLVPEIPAVGDDELLLELSTFNFKL